MIIIISFNCTKYCIKYKTKLTLIANFGELLSFWAIIVGHNKGSNDDDICLTRQYLG